jgi:putative endonuclease
MQLPDTTVVFVEVRQRATRGFGGAAASVGTVKQGRIVFAARHYLMRWRQLPPARFDVVVVEAEGLQWLQAAFDGGGV